MAGATPALHPISLEALAQMAAALCGGIDRNELTRATRQADLLALRQSVALDLHDSVAQALTGTRFWLNSISRRLAESDDPSVVPDVSERVATLADTIAFEQGHLNEIIARLREGEDVEAPIDLRVELPQLVTKLSARWQVAITLDLADGISALPAADVHEIKHLLREAIANAVRHGKAEQISIEVARGNGALLIAVTDDGRGFSNIDEAQQPWSIATRLGQMGGELNLAAPATGTRIEMTIPWRSN